MREDKKKPADDETVVEETTAEDDRFMSEEDDEEVQEEAGEAQNDKQPSEESVEAKAEDEEPAESDDDDDTDEGDDESRFDEGLIACADAAGISREEALCCKDNSALGKLIALRIKKSGQAPGQPENKSNATEDDDEIVLDEDVDPSIVKAFNKLQAKNKKLQEKVDLVEGASAQELHRKQQEDAARLNADIDAAIESLGEEYHELVGKGSVDDLDENSSEFKRRLKLVRKMDVLAGGYRSVGEIKQGERATPEQIKQMAREAALLVFPEQKKKTEDKDLKDKIKGRDSQIISTPNPQKGANRKTPKQKLLAEVTAKMQEIGAGTDEF